MHGLMMKAVQSFALDTYGAPLWAGVARRAGLERAEFEAMLIYDDAIAEAVLDALSRELGRSRATLLEDIGTYLVSDPEVDRLRRLLRFAGGSYEDFLHSLEDLPARALLAVSDLHLPGLGLRTHPAGRFVLSVDGGPQGFGHVMVGVLRAMADEYGALVMLDHRGRRQGREEIEISLVEPSFTKGRRFDLGGVRDDGR